MNEKADQSGPTLPPQAEIDKNIATWLDLMQTGHVLLMAGFRREAATEEEARAAYRRWYAGQMDEHRENLYRMLQRLQEGSKNDAC